LIPEPQVPPENPPPQSKQEPRNSRIDQMPRVVPLPQPNLPAIDRLPLPFPNSGPIVEPGPGVDPAPVPVRTGPRFATPDSLLKPPYPQQKLRLEQEAVLRLRLSIDERGRVTAVEPVGRADPVFLAAARRHLLAHWRYQPASEDGRPMASSTVITLRFQLND
jgi:protein TonB